MSSNNENKKPSQPGICDAQNKNPQKPIDFKSLEGSSYGVSGSIKKSDTPIYNSLNKKTVK